MYIRIIAADGSVSGALAVTDFDWVKWQSNGCMVLAGSREKAEGIAVPVNRTYLWNGHHPLGVDLPMAEEISEIEYQEIVGELDSEETVETSLEDAEPKSSLTRRELTEMLQAQAEEIAQLTAKLQELMQK